MSPLAVQPLTELARAIRHAQAHDRVGRNVAALIDTPQGRAGAAGR